MVTKRADKKKNIAKVAKTLIADPLLTEREVARKAGVGNGTVNRVKRELEQTGAKDDRIVGITDKDLDIVTLGQDIILDRLQDKKEVSKMRTIEIAQVVEKSEKRYQIFRGDATNREGGLKAGIIYLPQPITPDTE